LKYRSPVTDQRKAGHPPKDALLFLYTYIIYVAKPPIPPGMNKEEKKEEEKEEGLGVPPVGVGLSAAIPRPLRCAPLPVGFPLLSLTRLRDPALRNPSLRLGRLILLPGGVIILSGGMILLSGGVILLPGGMILLPGGVILLPGGVILLPGGVILLPGGVILLFGGVILLSRGVILLPGGVIFFQL
jgi:hypothetical protein